MAVTIEQLTTNVAMSSPEGVVSYVDSWRGTRSDDGHTVELDYSTGTASGAVQTSMDNWFATYDPQPVAPVASTKRAVSMSAIVDTVTGSIDILDASGKVMLKMSRDSAGQVDMQGVDSSGVQRRILMPQSGTVKLDSTATTLDVVYDVPFSDHPVVNINSSKPLPNYDLVPTKTGFTMDFASPADSTLAWQARNGKK